MATLGTYCRFVNGGTPSKANAHFFEGHIPWITSADIVGPVADVARSFITSEAIKSSAANIVSAGTVLLVTRTGVGKVAVAGSDLSFSQDITAVIPDAGELDSGYLVQYLRANQPYFVRQARGATIKGITRDVVADLEIPVPALPEQRRIAAILDQADALRAMRREALAQLDSLTQSIFIAMFGDPATNPKHWPVKRIGDLGRAITGNTPPRENPANYGDAIEWIKSDNINTPHYYLTKADEGLSDVGKKLARTAPPGAILVTCIAGSPDCIGNAAMADREVAFNQQINAFVPERGDPHFFYAQILVGKKLIQQASTNGMKGMVSKGKFEQIKLIDPPVDLQREFARRAMSTEKLKVAHLASLGELDTLFRSLQHRAFRGEL